MNSQTIEDIRIIDKYIVIDEKSVLELGCGTGRISFAIAERVQDLVALDIDLHAIGEAKQRNSFKNDVFVVRTRKLHGTRVYHVHHHRPIRQQCHLRAERSRADCSDVL